MTITELAQLMNRTPLDAEPKYASRVKLAFLLNLLANQTFTERQLLDARDALYDLQSRALINHVLGIPRQVEHAVDLAEEGAPTVIPLALMAEDRRDITRRLVLFLRPDPKMTIEVEKKVIETEPQLAVFQMAIEDGRGGSWLESFASEDTLRAFLRGVRVTYAMSDLQQLLPDFGDAAPLQFTEQSAVQSL